MRDKFGVSEMLHQQKVNLKTNIKGKYHIKKPKEFLKNNQLN